MEDFEFLVFSQPAQFSKPRNLDHFTKHVSKVVFKSRVIIEQPDCLLNNQIFYFSHRTWQEMVDLVQCVHETSYCKCGEKSLTFHSFPSEFTSK